jgi:serine/threonine-protein kinase RsbW
VPANHDGSSAAHPRPGAAEAGRARQMTLPSAAQSAGLARAATREVLASWQLAHLEETAVLLVSELVGNAVRHARTGGHVLSLRIEAADSWLRIEVHDADPRPPRPSTPTGLEESGFGFVLVDALADKWGVRETTTGKAVWVELDAGQVGDGGPGVRDIGGAGIGGAGRGEPGRVR